MYRSSLLCCDDAPAFGLRLPLLRTRYDFSSSRHRSAVPGSELTFPLGTPNTHSLLQPAFFVNYNGLSAARFPTFPFVLTIVIVTAIIIIIMNTKKNLPLRSYFFSPMSARTLESKCSHSNPLPPHDLIFVYIFIGLRNYDLFLDVHRVEVEMTRLSDVSTTFRMALRDQSKPALLLFTESLQVRASPFIFLYFLLTRPL